MKRILLEAPVFTLEAALLAEDLGVDRLELCADIGEGGTTPGAGMLAFVKSRTTLPVFAMVRPRGGDFCYSREEIFVMEKEIDILRSHGADGFVFGVLKPDGTVHGEACQQLIEKAGGLPCTFHRAFDASADLEASLEKIVACGFQRILTSGGKQTVKQGLQTIKKLLRQAGERIIIISGGGTSPDVLGDLNAGGYLREIHASCKTVRASHSTYFNPDLNLSGDPAGAGRVLTMDRDLVKAFRDAIDRL